MTEIDANAEEDNFFQDNKLLKGAGYFLLFEGLFALNSGMAAAAPPVYGTVGLILTPLGATGRSIATDLTGMALFACICTYNLIAPSKQDLTKKEIFTHNMVGCHIFALGVGTAELLIRDKSPKPKEKYTISIVPNFERPMVLFNLSF